MASHRVCFKIHTDERETFSDLETYALPVQTGSKEPKNICCLKDAGAIILSKVIRWLKKVSRENRQSGLNQIQINLKPYIVRLFFKPLRQIQGYALRKCQVGSASHSPEWFITFTISVKIFGAVELYLTFQNF